MHQPRYSIFEMFDNVLLLGLGGRTVYCGAATNALAYFAEQASPLPKNTNV